MKAVKNISIRGAKTHNLKGVDLEIPIQKISCIYGPSGSGKSSLAFHTLLAESKRRYLNSLPNDVKFFWNMPTAAEVDSIYPVLPVWGLAQSNPILGARPNFADSMGLTEMIQRLFHSWAETCCPTHLKPLIPIDMDEVFESELKQYSLEDNEVLHFLIDRSTYQEIFPEGPFPSRSYDFETDEIVSFDEQMLYWELFRIKYSGINKLKKKLSEYAIDPNKVFFTFKDKGGLYKFPEGGGYKCEECDYARERITFSPDELSPYSASGACPNCSGHGMNLEYDRTKVVKYPYLSIGEGAISLLESSHFSYLYPYLEKELKKQKLSLHKPFEELPQDKLWKLLEEGSGDFPGLKSCYDYLESKRYKRSVRIFSRKLKTEILCQSCEGTRINPLVHNLIIPGSKLRYVDFYKLNLDSSYEEILKLKKIKLKGAFLKRVEAIESVLEMAISLGLGRLPLTRKAKSLSSSEYQRCILTKILSYQGSGSLFVLDEPSRDLTIDEQKSLFSSLESIKDQGNTILLVEHSEYMKSQSDFLIEMGPGAGPEGGEILNTKTQKKKVYKDSALEEKSIKTKMNIHVEAIEIEGRKFQDLLIPIGKTTAIWGDSSSLKNSFLIDYMANTLNYKINEAPLTDMRYLLEDKVKADFEFEGLYLFDSQVTRTNSRSTVGTSIGLATELRKYFASLVVSKNLGLSAGHFSPNSELGRCPTCEGKGIKEVEMSFLEDITLVCEDCDGKQLRPFISNITDGHFSVYEALNRPMQEVIPHLKLTPKYKKIWDLVKILKLEYLSLNRSLSSLSGGERLRIKLLSQLSKKLENSLLIFENISSGLSEKEVSKLFDFIDSLKFKGNSLIIIDQNPVIINKAENTIMLK